MVNCKLSAPPRPPCRPPAPQCVVNAHDTPLQCLEYAEERDELATCGMGNKVKIWDIKRPAQVGAWRALRASADQPVV